MTHVPVENESDDVLCPECNEKMRKDTDSNFPMSDPPKSDNWTGIHGHAFCDNADCPVHKEQKLVDWSYRTGGVTYRVTPIPAACEGEVSQNSPPDEEPDDDDEAVKARGES